MIVNLILIIVLGLVFGSFISAISFRIPRNISFVNGRSFCPACKAQIKWFDNIPLVSYLILRGKCRSCKKKISLRYSLIELFSALFFILIYLYTFPNIATMVLYLVAYLIAASIFIIDFEHGIIPDELIFTGFIISFFYLLIFRNELVFQQLFYSLALSLFMLLIHLITKGKGMGLGDVKYPLFPGLLLIFPKNIVWLLLSFVIGSIIGVLLIIIGKTKFGKKIPFGPFLSLSFLIVLLWGDNIIKLLWL